MIWKEFSMSVKKTIIAALLAAALAAVVLVGCGGGKGKMAETAEEQSPQIVEDSSEIGKNPLGQTAVDSSERTAQAAGGLQPKNFTLDSLPIHIDSVPFGTDIESVKKSYDIAQRSAFKDFGKEYKEFHATVLGKKTEFHFSDNKLYRVVVDFDNPCDYSKQLWKYAARRCNDDFVSYSWSEDCRLKEWRYGKNTFITVRTCCADGNEGSVLIESNSDNIGNRLTWAATIDTLQQLYKDRNFREFSNTESKSADVRMFTLFYENDETVAAFSEGESEVCESDYIFYQSKLIKVVNNDLIAGSIHFNPGADKQIFSLLEKKEWKTGCSAWVSEVDYNRFFYDRPD
jgi:hypothetical protein